jgi:hypothetical protein
MSALRRVYRHPYVEPVLLACIGLQVISGVVLVGRRLARRATPIETLQSAAGAYLGLFFASHLTAPVAAGSRPTGTGSRGATCSAIRGARASCPTTCSR